MAIKANTVVERIIRFMRLSFMPQNCDNFGINWCIFNVVCNKLTFNTRRRTLMKQLSETWFVEPLFDYEYKSYEVLAFAKEVKKHFESSRLFPYLAEVSRHTSMLKAYRLAKEAIGGSLRTDLLEIDLKRLQLIRDAIPDKGGVMAELDQIIAFAEEVFERTHQEGNHLLEDLTDMIEIHPVGIVAAPGSPGYLLFRRDQKIRVYSYHYRLVRRAFTTEAYKDVCTQYHSEWTLSRFENVHTIKCDLIKGQRQSSVAATNAFVVETSLDLPQYETLLPIAKQHLIKAVA